MTPEQRKKRNERLRRWWANRTPEQKAARKKSHREWYHTASEDKRGAVREYQRNRRSSLTPEQKEQHNAYNRRWNKNLSADARRKRQDAQNAWRAWEYPERPHFFLAQSHKRRARLKGNGGTYTNEEWSDLLDLCGHRCLRCGRTESEVKLTADHIVPVSKGGSNSIDNIQPLCQPCNSWKGDRVMVFGPIVEAVA